MQKEVEKCAKCKLFYNSRVDSSSNGLQCHLKKRAPATEEESKSFWMQVMSVRLKAVTNLRGLGSGSRKISMQQCRAVEVVAVPAETLKTKRQSGGLKQATQKGRKKGKE